MNLKNLTYLLYKVIILSLLYMKSETENSFVDSFENIVEYLENTYNFHLKFKMIVTNGS